MKSRFKSPRGFGKWTFIKMSIIEKLKKVLKYTRFFGLLDHYGLIYRKSKV